MTELLAQPVPSNAACVAEQGLALRKHCDWTSAKKISSMESVVLYGRTAVKLD
jgi:hypothetical protein